MSQQSIKVELDKLTETMTLCQTWLASRGMVYDTADLIAMASAVVANETRCSTAGMVEELLSSIADGVKR